MSGSTIAFSSQPNATTSYARNVAAAARNFIVALLAVKPANATAQTAAADTAAAAATGKPGNHDFSLFRLYCLASRASLYDSVSPKLARELQLIASRG